MLHTSFAYNIDGNPDVCKSLLRIVFDLLRLSGSSAALEVLMHSTRYSDTLCVRILQSPEHFSALAGLLHEADTEIMTMALLTLDTVLQSIAQCPEFGLGNVLDLNEVVRILEKCSAPNASAAAYLLSNPAVWDSHGVLADTCPDSELSKIVLTLIDDQVLDEGAEFGLRQSAGFDRRAVSLLEGPLRLLKLCVQADAEARATVAEHDSWRQIASLLSVEESRPSDQVLTRVHLLSPYATGDLVAIFADVSSHCVS